MMLPVNWLTPIRFWIFFAGLIAVPLAGHAQNYPTNISLYVNDFANLLDEETEARVDTVLRNAKKTRDLEITVVTIERMADYGFSGDIAEFGTGLFNFWGVGDPNRNDGILILVARTDRHIRIALGSGYPPCFDDRVKRVIDEHFIPWFKQDRYAEGIEAGVLETLRRTKFDFGDEGRTVRFNLAHDAANVLDRFADMVRVPWNPGAMANIGSYLVIRINTRHFDCA